MKIQKFSLKENLLALCPLYTDCGIGTTEAILEATC